MTTSELVTPMHRARKALIYIRQSTPQQVLTNRESLELQYALRQRALELGWPPDAIEVIDADLGMTGASAHHRAGYKEVVAQVTLGQVGIILSSEVNRLSRNCSDWYPLLDICGYKGCLIADREGVYDPATPNGRLLLGLKGQLSELELYTIRARMTAGLLNKAERGELGLALPVGLVRNQHEEVEKDPNLEVQARIELVFSSFLRLRSAAKVLRFFNEQELRLPRRNSFADLVWKKPTVAAILELLKNPAYAGAFVYGRTRTRHDGPAGKGSVTRLPREEWRILVRDKYPPYINWETFEQIQTMLQDNYAEYDHNQARGVPRAGSALLQGLVYCGECGHKMVVQYQGGTRYLCNYLRQTHGVLVCQDLPGDPVDAAVCAAFFEALSPLELDAYAQAVAAQQQTDQQIAQAQQQQLTRLRYQAALAERQYQQVDPANRLVAAELERRWEEALRALQSAEERATQQQQRTPPPVVLPPDLIAAFTAIGQRLPTLWQQAVLTRQQKKALLRCLIEKVVVHRSPRDRAQIRIVWQGGDTTELTVPIPVGAFTDLTTAAEMEKLIVDLAKQGQTDEEIAQLLTEQGHRSPMRQDVVLPNTVRIIRLKHKIFLQRSQSHPRRIPGYLTVTQLAQQLDLTPHWVYDRIHNGTIQIVKDPAHGLFLFPDNPHTLDLFRQLKDGQLHNLRFSEGHQDE